MTDTVQCVLCPHACVIRPGERGTCKVRLNRSGELVSLVYGKPVAVSVDPVEKKPLFHFLPGSASFSIACVGCNLGCLGCQNWEISQAAPEDVPPYDMPPREVVEEASRAGCRSISYTYTEPVVWFEYVADTAALAREAGLANILVTAGYINEGPLRELAAVMDAANLDVKGATDSFYRTMCRGTLAPVLRSLEVLLEEGVWLEVTNLVIPGWNDTSRDFEALVGELASRAGSSTPLHFSRFFPMYRLLDVPPTPLATLQTARDIARDAGFEHVYTGNVAARDGATTFCPSCGDALIVRSGYTVESNVLVDGACPSCGTAIPGRWR